VKICSLYGAGFYYMPGTDMCIKVGGYARMEITDSPGGNMTWGPFNNTTNQRTTNNVVERARAYITADAREETAYGVARGYIAVGIDTNDTGAQSTQLALNSNRAFVQWAGFTAGLAQSFYDFYSTAAMQYRGGYLPASDTGDGGWWVWGYTAQFGGGFSGTIALEQRREMQVINGNCAATANGTVSAAGVTGATPTCGSVSPGAFPVSVTAAGFPLSSGSSAEFPGFGAMGGEQVPDVVGNLRVDQGWGSAQVMAAYHDVNASYYGTTATGAPSVLGGGPSAQAGFVVGGGLKINFPMVAPGDYFQSQFNYTQGATRYLFNTDDTNMGFANGTNLAWGVLSDCVYGGTTAVGNTTGCNLTTAWGFNAGYEHYWTPQWHQSLYGAYYAVNYNSAANAMLCTAEGFGAAGGGTGSLAVAGSGCNNNWATWGVGTRLQWDVTKSFYIGVEALYEQLNSATTGSATNSPGTVVGSASSGITQQQSSASAWSFTVRMHKDFLP
jgi:hypothetical protein